MITENIKQLIRHHEGLRLSGYDDTMNILTIGYGHRILPGEDFSSGITLQQAKDLLDHDLDIAENAAQELIANYNQLNEPRRGVIIDLVYNLGSDGFSKFHRTIAAIEAEDFESAATDLEESLWYKQVKTRGTDDCRILRSGVW